jgi:hypothetical protein
MVWDLEGNCHCHSCFSELGNIFLCFDDYKYKKYKKETIKYCRSNRRHKFNNQGVTELS